MSEAKKKTWSRHGDGVSYEDEGGGRWRIRWRERTPEGRWRDREKTISATVVQRNEYVVMVQRALAESGHFDPNAQPVFKRPPANLLAGMLACIDARENSGKYRGKTAETYRSYTLRTVESIQALERIPEDQPVSVEVLNRSLFERLQARDRQRDASDMMRYAPLRLLLDCWRWMADDPERWPHVPRPPFSSSDFLPRTPKYGRTIAPTMAHVDAALRHLKPRVERPTLMLGIFMRYTGLRAKQVLAIHRHEVNVEGRMLYDVTGKTAREQADLRPIPLAARLFEEPGVMDFLALAEPNRPLFRKRRHKSRREEVKHVEKVPSQTFHDAWAAAEAANEVPSRVWRPSNRKNARPEHALRAAFQAFLEGEGVARNVLDYLVGHEGETVRDVHYSRELLDDARKAVDLIPPTNWGSTPDADLASPG